MYMTIFWILIVIVFVVHYIIRKTVNENKANDIAVQIGFVAISFLIVAIATKDPLFEPLGIPAGYEWVIGTVTGFAIIWKYYLRPFDKRLIALEQDMVSIKSQLNSEFSSLKQDMSLIKHKLLN